MKSVFVSMVLMCGLLCGQKVFAQAHAHLNIGAPSTAQGAKLIFDNAAEFAPASGYVKTLEYTNSSKYAGYYQQNITLTVLPATSDYGGPALHAPALGSQIVARMSLLSAPAGGSFGFWDSDSTTAPSISVTNGETSTNVFYVSQTDGQPGVDPFGHIHGRRFSATKPGFYLVGFQAIDLCHNGAGGGPIHTPSDVFAFWFQAGVNLRPVFVTNGASRITYGSVANRNCIVECSTNLSQTNWTAITTNAGNDLFQSVTNIGVSGPQRFYRVRVSLP